MEKSADLEKPLEMEILNGKIEVEEKFAGDKEDGEPESKAESEKEAKAHVAFVHNMDKRISQLYHWAKYLIFVVAAILFFLFLVYDIFAGSEKNVPEEVNSKLMNIMKNQAGGSFSPIVDDSTNSSLIQSSNQ